MKNRFILTATASLCTMAASTWLTAYTVRVSQPKPQLAAWQTINLETFAELDRKNLFYSVRTGLNEQSSVSDPRIAPVLALVVAASQEHDAGAAQQGLVAAKALPAEQKRQHGTWPSPLLGRLLDLV